MEDRDREGGRGEKKWGREEDGKRNAGGGGRFKKLAHEIMEAW